jgi:hypothetical protein
MRLLLLVSASGRWPVAALPGGESRCLPGAVGWAGGLYGVSAALVAVYIYMLPSAASVLIG